MGRKAKPRVWREWYVSEAGGQGMHKLCLVSEGPEKAEDELERYLEGLKKDQQQAKEAGLVQADTPYTVSHIAAEFLQMKEATKKASTFEFYQKSLQRFEAWYGDLEARKLGITHAADFIAKLKRLSLTNVTINHEVQAAKAVLNYAVEAGRLVKNPWKKAEKLPEWGRKRVVTDEEFEKLLKACDSCIAYRGVVSREDNAQLMKDILHTLRFTAMRPGELRHLRWDHLHLEDGFIIIPASEQKTVTTAKVPKDRIIPILDDARDILLRRKEKYGHQDRVFPSIMGKEWNDQLFSPRFARLRKRAGSTPPTTTVR
jgi:integrase